MLWGCAIAVFVLLAWLTVTGWRVAHGLTGAQNGAQAAKDAILAGDVDNAKSSAQQASSSASAAVEASESTIWRAFAAIPGLGRPFETVRQIARVVDGLTSEVVVPAMDAGGTLSVDRIALPGGKINLAELQQAIPTLERASAAIRPIAEEARNVPSAGFVGPIDDARLQLQHLTDELNANLDNGLLAARIAPTMLGADGPRTYFLAFQTPAEARGTGGLVGGFGVIRAEDGSVGMDSLASNNNIPFWKKYAPLDLGPDFAETYSFTDRSATTDLRNSNFSSNFPYAGKIWQSLWEQESGMRIDGAIATDPIALSYILAAIGPVRLPGGDVVSADNIVETTMSTNYIRFADDNDARKQYLQDIAAAVVSKMTGDLEAPQALLKAFGRAAREGRLAVWSDHPAEQAVLASTAVGHTVADVASPYAEVVINNHGGNKMDYYLRREIDYSAADCASDTRKSTVTVRLTNAATPEVAEVSALHCGRSRGTVSGRAARYRFADGFLARDPGCHSRPRHRQRIPNDRAEGRRGRPPGVQCSHRGSPRRDGGGEIRAHRTDHTRGRNRARSAAHRRAGSDCGCTCLR